MRVADAERRYGSCEGRSSEGCNPMSARAFVPLGEPRSRRGAREQAVKRVRNPEGGTYRVRQSRVSDVDLALLEVLKGSKPHERHREAAADSRSPAGGQALKEPQHHERKTRLGLAPCRADLGAGRPQDPGMWADGLAAPFLGRGAAEG
jgi:hypothetical protein